MDAQIIGVPAPPGNLAITSAERRDRRVVASVQNYGNSEARVAVRLVAGGKDIATANITMAARGSADAELIGPLPANGDVEVRIDDPGGYQPDNVRRVRLDPSPSARIAVVVADPTGSTGGLYVERALGVAGAGQEFDVDIRDGGEVPALTDADLSRLAAMFILGTRTLERGGRELIRKYLSGGGQVLLTLGPDVDTGTLADVLGTRLPVADEPVRSPGATMIASDNRHPIFRPFLNPSGALGDVQVDRHRRLNDQADASVLARFSGGDAALTEQIVGQGRLLVFTSDLDNAWSRFPLNPAFVPFAVETARYLTKPSRQSTAAQAVASLDVRESNPAAMSVEEFTNAIERTSRAGLRESRNTARDIEDRQRWWQVGIIVMLVALAGEALLGRRTT